MIDPAKDEVSAGQRFAFGRNWQRFLADISEERIAESVRALRSMLEVEHLENRTFLDVGSGSGLSSLAARRLGARVRSFDYDPASVACTRELRRRYFPDDSNWVVEQGSALDAAYVQSLGKFDVVYSWGVLHHTGRMWPAIETVMENVASGGKFFISLYNDQGRASKAWYIVKKTYNASPTIIRAPILLLGALVIWGPPSARDLVFGRPFDTWRNYKKSRGMSPWRDLVDWIGGYPFEVASPAQVFQFCHRKGFNLQMMTTCAGRHGCNEFVFERT